MKLTQLLTEKLLSPIMGPSSIGWMYNFTAYSDPAFAGTYFSMFDEPRVTFSDFVAKIVRESDDPTLEEGCLCLSLRDSDCCILYSLLYNGNGPQETVFSEERYYLEEDL